MLFHVWIAQELAKIEEKDIIEPTYAITERDHVVGEMSKELKKLFTLRFKTRGEFLKTQQASVVTAQKLFDASPKDPKKADIDKIREEFQKLEASLSLAEAKDKAVEEDFFMSVRDEFPSVNGYSIIVGKGFKIAWAED